MARVGRRDRAELFLRSFAIQGSWNYRTLLGSGFAFALLPVLRRLHGEDPVRLRAAVERHTGLFNSHPYIAPMALGAVASLEAEAADPKLIERFKAAVRGSLGMLGDRLVWAGWRPVCLLFALGLLLAGTPWWLGTAAFLVLYNLGHLGLRVWAYRLGWRYGTAVADRLRDSPVTQAPRILSVVGAFLVGLVLPLAASGGLATNILGAGVQPLLPWPWILAGALAAAIGVRWGAAVRTPVILALVVFTILGIAMRGVL